MQCSDKLKASQCVEASPTEDTMRYVNFHWDKYSPGRRIQTTKLSAGYFGIALAASLCAEVSIYGFKGDMDHYYMYPKKKMSISGHLARHSWKAEGFCMAKLARLGNVRVVR